MPDPEEIEMRRLWHAGQLVEPRVKLMRLRAVQEDAIISIDSGYYHRGEENPLPPLAELRRVLVPLDRREEEAAAQVTKVQARAEELEVLNRQIQAELSSKESQLDLAERLNQNLQSQLVNQAALASTNTALQEQVQSLRSDNQKTMDERGKWLPLVEKAGQVELLHKRIQDLERALSKANEEKARLIEERAEGERQRKELERSTQAEIKKLLQDSLKIRQQGVFAGIAYSNRLLATQRERDAALREKDGMTETAKRRQEVAVQASDREQTALREKDSALGAAQTADKERDAAKATAAEAEEALNRERQAVKEAAERAEQAATRELALIRERDATCAHVGALLRAHKSEVIALRQQAVMAGSVYEKVRTSEAVAVSLSSLGRKVDASSSSTQQLGSSIQQFGSSMEGFGKKVDTSSSRIEGLGEKVDIFATAANTHRTVVERVLGKTKSSCKALRYSMEGETLRICTGLGRLGQWVSYQSRQIKGIESSVEAAKTAVGDLVDRLAVQKQQVVAGPGEADAARVTLDDLFAQWQDAPPMSTEEYDEVSPARLRGYLESKLTDLQANPTPANRVQAFRVLSVTLQRRDEIFTRTGRNLSKEIVKLAATVLQHNGLGAGAARPIENSEQLEAAWYLQASLSSIDKA